jgi:hypothetical protein
MPIPAGTLGSDMEDQQVLIVCLVDDEHTRMFMQPTDVQSIDATNVAGILGGCVSTDDQLTIKDAKCIYCDMDKGCVILEIDGGYYPGTIYCHFADSVEI